MSDNIINLVVSSTDGSFCDFVQARESDTIGALKENIMELRSFSYDVSLGDIKLMSPSGTDLCNKKTLRDYHLNDQCIITMSIETFMSPNGCTYSDLVANGMEEYDEKESKEVQIYIAFVEHRSGFNLTVDTSMTIEGLKEKIMNKVTPRFKPEQQRLFLNGSNLLDDKTLAYYDIDCGANLFVMLRRDFDLLPPAEGRVLLYVGQDGKVLTITIESNDATIRQVKRAVWEKTGILPAFQRLNFNGEDLDLPDQVLSGYGIKTESFMYLYQRRERDPEPGYSILPASMNPDVVAGGGVVNDANMITIIFMHPTRGLAGSGVQLELRRDAPLRQIFASYSERIGAPAASHLQFLHEMYGELPHDCQLSPEDMGLENGCTFMVMPNMNMNDQRPLSAQSVSSNHDSDTIDLTPFSDSGSTITLTMVNIDNHRISAKIRESTSLQLLFDYFAEEVGIEGDLLMYKSNGKSFSHDIDKTASQCGIEDGDTITAVLRADEEERIESEKRRIESEKIEKTRAVLRRLFTRVRQRRELAKQHRERAHKTIADLIWKSAAAKRRVKLRNSAVQMQKAVRGHNAYKKWRRLRDSAILVQTISRGYLARKVYGDAVQTRMLEFQHFASVWKPTADLVRQRASAPLQSLSGWALVREKVNLKKTEDIDEDGNLVGTNEKLNKALAGALSETNKDEPIDDTESESDLENEIPKDHTNRIRDIEIDWSQFQVTHHVCKFLRNGDAKFREIFVKKMKQLGRGERSHKLQKPLQGCESIIYETYLENKSGWRILWTQEGKGLVIWFVCQHKSVSRYAKLIDDSKNRTARQQLPSSFISQVENGVSQQENKMDVKLDPIGNVPLKVYDIQNVDDIVADNWAPRMHLTREERDVVEAKGTVLLLGRSGTGKTICISNRIEFDRERLGCKADFSQLFVSRSKQLCRYVKDAVGEYRGSTFTTFDNLVSEIEISLSQLFIGRSFQRKHHVGFARFNNEFFSTRYRQEDISALIVWKAIRTFMKGSIEAFQQTDRVLSREHFVGEQLGKNRCQVPLELRDSIYSIFLQYQKWLDEQHLFDDCDRISALLKAIEVARKSHSQVFDDSIKKLKIYVDEVQDYTQVEILLFFYISGGPGALFLAGDPAQSVVEGTDFRFEEIRSVGYFVAGDARRHLIPEKPKVVNVNFRSHSGILNTAAAVLDFLFLHFPSSAKQLPKDHGLFNGSRPSVLQSIQVETLSTLLKEKLPGAVVLTHDETAAKWKEKLDHALVYGIREAKGMEFKSVIILDFFGELPESLQKPCRNLLLNRYHECDGFQQQFPLVEVYLKLLYTGITRCIEQLFFAESTSSPSGDAAVRWLTATKNINNTNNDGVNKEALATISRDVKDLEGMTMTNDEFCIVGIDNAEQAESNTYLPLETALRYLDRSIYCFQKAQRSDLVAKATVHAKSLKLKDMLTKPEDSMQRQDMESIETDVSQTIVSLVRENLLAESSSLLNTIIPLVNPYKQTKLEEYVVGPIDMLNR